MPITLDTLTRWLQAPAETERLEFKEAKQQFDSTKLMRLFVALANEGGGHVVLGVSDKPPRRVVGSRVPETDAAGLRDMLPRRLVGRGRSAHDRAALDDLVDQKQRSRLGLDEETSDVFADHPDREQLHATHEHHGNK